jgi:hypothetical protein
MPFLKLVLFFLRVCGPTAELVADADESNPFPTSPAVCRGIAKDYPGLPSASLLPATALCLPDHSDLLEKLEVHASGARIFRKSQKCRDTHPELVAGPLR